MIGTLASMSDASIAASTITGSTLQPQSTVSDQHACRTRYRRLAGLEKSLVARPQRFWETSTTIPILGSIRQITSTDDSFLPDTLVSNTRQLRSESVVRLAFAALQSRASVPSVPDATVRSRAPAPSLQPATHSSSLEVDVPVWNQIRQAAEGPKSADSLHGISSDASLAGRGGGVLFCEGGYSFGLWVNNRSAPA